MTSELQEPAAYGGQMAKYFRLGKAPSLVICPPLKPQIAITRLASPNGLPDRTPSIPHEKAYVVSVHLTPACDQGCEIWVDGRYSRITTWPAGGVAIYDLEADPHARNRGPIDWVHYHVPRSTLDVFTDDVQLASIEDGQIGLADLARECGLSVSHFTRSFRRSFGTSAHRYLILQRIEKAKSLLSNSASALSDVALQAGFSDQASFSRTFNAVVGTPPGHWRRKANSYAAFRSLP
jgi:AraC-like DNA-binding protein